VRRSYLQWGVHVPAYIGLKKMIVKVRYKFLLTSTAGIVTALMWPSGFQSALIEEVEKYSWLQASMAALRQSVFCCITAVHWPSQSVEKC